MLEKVFSYFALQASDSDVETEPMLGVRPKRFRKGQILWTVALYTAVFLGILGQRVLDRSTKFDVRTMVASIVIATVVFPYIHGHIKPNRLRPSGIDLFLAFQGGFFWNRAMEVVGKFASGS